MLSNIVLISAKYLILIFFALFVLVSFKALSDVPDAEKKGSFKAQRVFILLMHFVCFLCIFIHADQEELSFTLGKAVIFYVMQLIYLVAMSCVIPAIVSLNKGLNNIMCMFIALAFVVQTRLGFDSEFKQFFILIGATVIFLIFVFFCKKAKFLKNLTWIYCICGLLLLVLVYVLAHVTKGAKLAIDLGFFSFQPMEFVKIIFVFFVAAAFNKANTFKTVFITAVFAGLHIIILVLCTDLGSALILFVIYVIMVYVATKKFVYVLVGAVGFAAAAYVAWKLFSHVQIRVEAWLDPFANINDNGYQIAQSLFAIGTGGWFGTGILEGSPKLVPEVSNDMVFSAIAEEFGGIFCILLIALFLIFALMMMRVAIRVKIPFYKLLAFGLASVYGMQVFLNVGGTIKFIPLTGVNLPFISSGGSSLISSMILIGIIQALYVISESDVRKEREALAEGLDITEFSQDDIGKTAYEDDYYDEEDYLNEETDYDENENYYDYEYYDDIRSNSKRKRKKANDYFDDYEDDGLNNDFYDSKLNNDFYDRYGDYDYEEERDREIEIKRNKKRDKKRKNRVREYNSDDF